MKLLANCEDEELRGYAMEQFSINVQLLIGKEEWITYENLEEFEEDAELDLDWL